MCRCTYTLTKEEYNRAETEKRLAGLLSRKEDEVANAGTDNLLGAAHAIDSLVIIDRRVDMITPMLTQLTYEGLIDEMIGIKNGLLCSHR